MMFLGGSKIRLIKNEPTIIMPNDLTIKIKTRVIGFTSPIASPRATTRIGVRIGVTSMPPMTIVEFSRRRPEEIINDERTNSV